MKVLNITLVTVRCQFDHFLVDAALNMVPGIPACFSQKVRPTSRSRSHRKDLCNHSRDVSVDALCILSRSAVKKVTMIRGNTKG